MDSSVEQNYLDQIEKIAHENATLRSRVKEHEFRWKKMIERNKQLQTENVALRDQVTRLKNQSKRGQ
jgi:regulator of replication initiation timing